MAHFTASTAPILQIVEELSVDDENGPLLLQQAADVASVVILTCWNSISSSSIGLCLTQPSAPPVPLPLLQSKSTIHHPLVDCGSVKPVSSQGMMMVERFI